MCTVIFTVEKKNIGYAYVRVLITIYSQIIQLKTIKEIVQTDFWYFFYYSYVYNKVYTKFPGYSDTINNMYQLGSILQFYLQFFVFLTNFVESLDFKRLLETIVRINFSKILNHCTRILLRQILNHYTRILLRQILKLKIQHIPKKTNLIWKMSNVYK